MTIADELDKAMRDFRPGGITQPELAELSGVPQPTISRTLKGKSTPETKTLIKLAKTLKCTLGGYTGTAAAHKAYATTNVRDLKTKEPDALPPQVAEILKLAKAMTPAGQYVLLGNAQQIAKAYPKAKANRSS